MPSPSDRLRDIWEKSIKPLYTKKPPYKNLFGIRYEKMLELQKTLTPLEKDQMDFFIAVREMDGAVRHYPDYLKEASAFCRLRLENPESATSRKMDLNRLSHFETALNLLLASASSVGKDYMDRVRAEMPVPLTPEMRRRAVEAERQALRADIATLKSPKADN
ncbi:MAG: hypothetical protein JWO78_1215 [Micavibrio sp.]|nr:hypothetical protein [Micavibrio sp.]